MGWIFNTNTEARQYNNRELQSLLANVNEKGKILGSYHNQTHATIALLETASSFTQQSSVLGQKLAQTINDLKTHSSELQEQIEDTMLSFVGTNLMIEQYKLPRIKRTIDASGDEMAGLAWAGNLQIQVELPVINETHAQKMQQARSVLNEMANKT